MAYDESLAGRIREILDRHASIVERKMFGGIGFLRRGNMCVGIWKDSLIARIGAEAYEGALAEPHVLEFDVTGRPMTGWVMVQPEGVDEDQDLKDWVERALAFTATLPEK